MVHGSYNIKKEKICSKSAHVNTWSNGMKETDIIMRHDRGKRLAKLLMFSFVFFFVCHFVGIVRYIYICAWGQVNTVIQQGPPAVHMKQMSLSDWTAAELFTSCSRTVTVQPAQMPLAYLKYSRDIIRHVRWVASLETQACWTTEFLVLDRWMASRV